MVLMMYSDGLKTRHVCFILYCYSSLFVCFLYTFFSDEKSLAECVPCLAIQSLFAEVTVKHYTFRDFGM